MSQLSEYRCSTLAADEEAMSALELEGFLPLVPSWSIVDEDGVRKLVAAFSFMTEELADRFVEQMEQQSEREEHPVELDQNGSHVIVRCFTPALGGLHPNDFIMAARADGEWSKVLVGREGLMNVAAQLPTLDDAPRFRRIMKARRKRSASPVTEAQ